MRGNYIFYKGIGISKQSQQLSILILLIRTEKENMMRQRYYLQSIALEPKQGDIYAALGLTYHLKGIL